MFGFITNKYKREIQNLKWKIENMSYEWTKEKELYDDEMIARVYEQKVDWTIGGYVCSNCRVKNDNLPGYNDLGKLDPYMFAGSQFCPCCGRRMVKEKV